MATQTLTAPNPGSTTHLVDARPDWRLSFGGELRAEFTKLFTLRSSYWLLAFMLGGFTALPLLYLGTYDVASQGQGTISQSIFVLATMAGQMLIVVLGVIVASGEYSTGSIRSTLAAVPRRTPVLVAKSIVVSFVTAVITLASIGLSVAASIPLWGRTGAPAFTTDFFRLALLATFYLVCLSLIGLGLGMLIRATPGALCAGLGLVLVVPMVLTGFLGSFTWAQNLYRFMPDAQLNQMLSADMWNGADGMLAGWQSMAVLAGWVVVTLGAGWWRLAKTDA